LDLGLVRHSDQLKTDFPVSAKNKIFGKKMLPKIRPITNIRHKKLNIAKMRETLKTWVSGAAVASFRQMIQNTESYSKKHMDKKIC
jgi:hypothetical protein